MNVDFPIVQTIKARHSVRTYDDRPLSEETKDRIKAYIATLSSPFSAKPAFHVLETKSDAGGQKLGTYGVIRGAKNYIGATVSPGDLAEEALGYSFEKLILYMTSLGLGTCWLGGTFQRGQFASAMAIEEGDLFPAITPVGYPAQKKRLADSLIRTAAKSDQRKDWSELFYLNDFSHPLTKSGAGAFSVPLDMLRLAPSASNKQPWRIVQVENAFHFYKAQTPGYGEKYEFDIQKVDLGIAACHFHLTALEQGLQGTFEKLSPSAAQLPDDVCYIFSFVPRT